MYSITINIANAGSRLNPALSEGSDKSNVGHMWITISDGINKYDYGWHPNDPTRRGIDEPGILKTDDHQRYLDGPDSSYTILIDQNTYDTVRFWADQRVADGNRFNDGRWNARDGNCIDFAWQAAGIAGVDRSIIGDGSWWPSWNSLYFPTPGLPGTAEAEGWGGLPPGWDGETSRVNDAWRDALQPRPRDPLSIDLDGDGIETKGIPTTGNSILFDHDADGIRTGTGWLKPDDAWLVRDLNGNGSIDSGRELFGVDTRIQVFLPNLPTTAGPVWMNASSGFQALAALDVGPGTNVVGSPGFHDNVINALDAPFAELKVWRDLNQDGISQVGELQTLAQAGIASISLTTNTTPVNLGNGNSVTATATVTRTNGTTTNAQTVAMQAANLNLADNPFYREFADTIPLTAAARGLPEMGGSGWLRDLREAMSLGSIAAQQLELNAAQFAAETTRDQQQARLDSLLADWANTTGRVDTADVRPVQSIILSDNGSTRVQRSVTYDPGAWPNPATTLVECVEFKLPDTYYLPPTGPYARPELTEAGQKVIQQLGMLEAFNGARFFDITESISYSSSGGGSGGGGGGGSGSTQLSGYVISWLVNLMPEQIELLASAYDALRESVYRSLALQTRLRPYLDAIDLVIDDSGVHFDTTAMTALQQTRYQADGRNALLDLVELNQWAHPTLQAVGHDGMALLRTWMDALPANSPVRAEVAAMGVYSGAATVGGSETDLYLGDTSANTFVGGDGLDVLDGGAGNDTLEGGNDSDFLYGRDGADTLQGQEGDDLLDGGAGNDTLVGGAGHDVYRFGRGDGQDSIANFQDASADKANVLRFKPGVAPTDVLVRQVASAFWGWNADLEFSIVGTTDKITVGGLWRAMAGLGNAYCDVQSVEFDDGTVWDYATLTAMALAGTAGADTLGGTAMDDNILGGMGNDFISGNAGDDTLAGEGDADSLAGGDGNDTLLGGPGADTLDGEAGNDALDGGSGSDLLRGGVGNNVYQFGKGDGQDIIENFLDSTAGKSSTLLFKTGVLPAEIVVRQVYSAFWGWNADLEFSIVGTTDKITVGGMWRQLGGFGGEYTAVQTVQFSDGTVWNPAAITAAVFAGTAGADAVLGGTGNDTITGQAGDDALGGNTGNDTLRGGLGADTVDGDAGADTLDGGAGDDMLRGGVGNDMLDGGAGNDMLLGGDGDNVYLFGKGDGQDTIDYYLDSTAGKNSTLLFKAGVIPAEIAVRQVYNPAFGWNADLEFSIVGTTDKVVVGAMWRQVGGLGGDYTSVQNLQFADGTVWNTAAIAAKLFAGTGDADVIVGGAGADTINGQAGNDTLSGNVGNDTLRGGLADDILNGDVGNDTLDGGTGNDMLRGGVGNNVYQFGKGDGQDAIDYLLDSTAGKNSTLLFKAGVLPAEISVRQVYNAAFGWNADLEFSIAGTTDKIVVGAMWRQVGGAGGEYTPVQTVQFSNGTVWNTAAIATAVFAGTALADTIVGGTGNDTINGQAGNDSLSGGAGNDTLNGGSGVDTLVGGAGNDVFIVDSTSDVTTENPNEGTDAVQAGVTWTLGANLENLTLTGSTAINGTGNALANVLTGNAANNTMTGGEGSDTYAGAAGNDTLVDASTSSADVYRWGLNLGNDTINDAGGTDRVELGSGITAAQLTYSHVGSDLRIGITGQTNSLTVLGWYTNAAKRVETIKFADGSSINLGTSAPLSNSDRARASYWRGDALDSDRAATAADAYLDSQASALVNAMATFQAGAEGSLSNMAWQRPEPVSWMVVDGR